MLFFTWAMPAVCRPGAGVPVEPVGKPRTGRETAGATPVAGLEGLFVGSRGLSIATRRSTILARTADDLGSADHPEDLDQPGGLVE